MSKKKSGFYMGEYKKTKEDYEACIWCIKNGIHISPMANKEGSWWIDITISGNTNRSPKSFVKDTVWEKYYEYCKYYYDKHKK
tara:strand:+ start:116 stop:364 length:249 start_codon:yes stop_codon:yes gene_type:complete